MKAQKARALGLAPQGASRPGGHAGAPQAHTGFIRFWEEGKGRTDKEGERGNNRENGEKWRENKRNTEKGERKKVEREGGG